MFIFTVFSIINGTKFDEIENGRDRLLRTFPVNEHNNIKHFLGVQWKTKDLMCKKQFHLFIASSWHEFR